MNASTAAGRLGLHRIGLGAGVLPLSEDPLFRVIEVQREGLVLHDGDHAFPARQLPALREHLALASDALAVGDWAHARLNRFGEWWVHTRLPPRNQLARRLHDGRDKVERTVIVSNVDTALLVMGLDGDFNLRRLERFVTLARTADVEPLLVLTKADLCSDPESRRQAAQQAMPPGSVAVALDARSEAATEVLAPWLVPGRTLALLGASGAGKSTLTNTLAPEAAQATGANRAGDSRGRHTTTSRSLHRAPGGACIIDTPGLRTLRLDADAGGIERAFDDIATLASACRFRNCRHEGEPGCAVSAAVPGERLKNFHKLQREAERDTMTALERKAQMALWKARGRAGSARALFKRRGLD